MAEIYQALNSEPTDVAALRRMAISEGGLLTDEIRRKVWPKLLNVNTSDPPPISGSQRKKCCEWAGGVHILLQVGGTLTYEGLCHRSKNPGSHPSLRSTVVRVC